MNNKNIINRLMDPMRLYILLCLGFFSCQPFSTNHSEAELEIGPKIQKAFIHPQNGYSQVVEVNTNGIRTLYVSGQIGDGEGLAEQMRSALKNLEQELMSCGATMKDIVKMNTYIVDYSPDQLEIFRNVRKDVMGEVNMPASTLVGVEALALDKWIIEIEAVAILADTGKD